MRIFRGFVVWLSMMLAESLHGMARSILLDPYVGDFQARQISVLTGAIIIFVIAFAFARWLRATNVSNLIIIGILWLILTVSFEVVLGKFVLGHSWERIFSDYNLAEGGLLSIGLIFMAFSPLIAAKTRRII